MVIGDGVRGVGGKDANDDRSQYAPSSSLHSAHESDSKGVSQ